MRTIFLTLLIGMLTSGCELLDPTGVNNPNVTEDTFTGSFNSGEKWLLGTDRQMATTVGTMVEFGELTSDNYFNNRTLSSKVFDIPQIDFIDIDVRRLQDEIHTLREMANFGLTELVPNDPLVTDNMRAEWHFYLGMSHLFSGEYFIGLPAQPGGEVLSSDENLERAIEEFEVALDLSDDSEAEVGYRLAIARAYYHLGDATNARSFAEQVIASNNRFLRFAQYDGIEGFNNPMQFLLFESSNDEFAPLPRLDFLDPKYFSQTTASLDQRPIYYLKAEEAYFILAEIELGVGQVGNAREVLKNLIEDVIDQRPMELLDDSRELRGGGNRDDYPLAGSYRVRFDADDSLRSGFVVDRQAGPINAYPVSGTSVNAVILDEVNTEDQLLEILYQMRQEVFIAEGRRVTDLGIKYQVHEDEFTRNPNVTEAHLVSQIPTFIPRETRMDDFVNNEGEEVVTMTVNMNKILVQNKSSEFVLPFH